MGTPGSGRVAVVTDSTAYLPVETVERQGIGVVPLQVTIGDHDGDENVEIGPDEVAAALTAHQRVTTSRPVPERFAAAYDTALANGASAIVTVTLSRTLSGTWESAVLASNALALEARVVDSRSTAMGLGFAVLAAAAVAAAGGSAAEVEEAARARAAKTRTLFSVDTLEHLRRGGRVGAVRALVSTALSVKPLLHVVDGEIVVADKVRTTSKARARLVELGVADVAGPVDVAVHHLAAPDQAAEIAAALRERLDDVRSLVTTELGAVIGAHVGPGALGVVVAPALPIVS
jgi:DegV family protein with EDD domain